MNVAPIIAPIIAGVLGLLGFIYKTLIGKIERLGTKVESFVTEEKVRLLISERLELQKMQNQYLTNSINELRKTQEQLSFKLDKILEALYNSSKSE